MLVLATRVHLGFERIRIRAVKEPQTAHEPSLRVPLPDVSRLAGEPAAVVLRLRGGTESAVIQVSIDGAVRTEVRLPERREKRIDTSAHLSSDPGQVIVITGDRAGWQLTYLEIANVHGFTSGLLAFEVVPRDRETFNRISREWLPPIFVALLLLRGGPKWPAGRAARRVYRMAAGLVVAVFLVAVLGERVTPYKLILSLQTFALCTAVLYVERLVQLWRAAARVTPRIASAAGGRSLVLAAEGLAAWPRLPPTIAASLAVVVAVAALAWGTRVAGGSDSYGYVSQAELWARRQLSISQPIAGQLPTDLSDSVLTPLGYSPHHATGIRGQIVPTYSPGLPLIMAAFRLVGGVDAVYLVVPALAGLTVWLTFILGRRLDGDVTGLIGALLVASSPAFHMSMLHPMSDVPVTAWWLLALVAACSRSRWSAAIAGAATSLAILTRPNLAPLAVFVGLPFVWRAMRERETRQRHATELAWFVATAAPGAALVGALFNYWYGSPLRSGYGAAGEIFSWSFVQPNLARYPRWFIDSQTPLIAAALAAPLMLRGRSRPPGRPGASALSWLMLAMCAFVWMVYLVYVPFDSPDYLRFVLPTYPLLFVLAGAVLVALLHKTAAPRMLGATLIALLMIHGCLVTARAQTFGVASGESRYRRVGEFVARALPRQAVLLSMQHSGSLRHYSRRVTIRYDSVPEDRLDQLLTDLETLGFAPYIVLDAWEEEPFRARFGSRNLAGRLDWAPAAVAPGVVPVAIYDPRDRVAANPAATRTIR